MYAASLLCAQFWLLWVWKCFATTSYFKVRRDGEGGVVKQHLRPLILIQAEAAQEAADKSASAAAAALAETRTSQQSLQQQSLQQRQQQKTQGLNLQKPQLKQTLHQKICSVQVSLLHIATCIRGYPQGYMQQAKHIQAKATFKKGVSTRQQRHTLILKLPRGPLSPNCKVL